MNIEENSDIRTRYSGTAIATTTLQYTYTYTSLYMYISTHDFIPTKITFQSEGSTLSLMYDVMFYNLKISYFKYDDLEGEGEEDVP